MTQHPQHQPPDGIPSVYRPVGLLTNHDTFLCWFWIPPFQMLPDVVSWGTRVFLRGGSRDTDGVVYEFYRECFYYGGPAEHGTPENDYTPGVIHASNIRARKIEVSHD